MVLYIVNWCGVTSTGVVSADAGCSLGDGDFLSNGYFSNNGNGELGGRMINWLSNDDDFILIPSKTVMDTQLKTPFIILGILGVGFLFLIPIILTTVGVFIQFRRKKQ